jgi:hypothetical protein
MSFLNCVFDSLTIAILIARTCETHAALLTNIRPYQRFELANVSRFTVSAIFR